MMREYEVHSRLIVSVFYYMCPRFPNFGSFVEIQLERIMKAPTLNPLSRLLMAFGLLASASAWAADHLDGPLAASDRAADLNDVYAFINPNDADELILVATLFPLANESSQFSPAVEYRFNIENSVAPPVLAPGNRMVIGCRAMGKRKAQSMRCALAGTDTVAGKLNQVNYNDDGVLRMFAGLRDDPFFFDLVGFQETLANLAGADPQQDGFTDPGEDFFAPLNSLAIVVGVDLNLLTDNGNAPVLAVYGSTHRADSGKLTGSASKGGANAGIHTLRQIDRIGRPAVNTALIDPYSLTSDPALKDVYNTTSMIADWPVFIPELQANLEYFDTVDGIVGNTPLSPADLAFFLADDRLLVDTTFATCDNYLSVELTLLGVFLNQCGGRALQHDVIDDTLGLIIGSAVSDNVDDGDNVYLPDFPFVGIPQ